MLDFDGVDDKVDHGNVGNPAGLDEAAAVTIAMWIIPDTVAAGRAALVGKTTATVIAVLLERNDDDIKIFHDTGGNTGVTTSNLLVVGTPIHVASVFNGAGTGNAGRQQIYLNGTNETLTFAGTIPAALGNGGGNPILIGSPSLITGSGFFDGKIGLVKIWTAVLTAAEILEEMHSFRAMRTANLLISSPYDDLVAANDYSGGRRHGTVTGALQRSALAVSYRGED